MKMKKTSKTCTITGVSYDKLCRILGENENEPPCIAFKKRLSNAIWQLHCGGVSDFWLNSERGIPMWAAEIIGGLKMYNAVGLHIAVPSETHNIDWSEDWRDRYYAVHEKADSVHIPRRMVEDFAAESGGSDVYADCDERIADFIGGIFD